MIWYLKQNSQNTPAGKIQHLNDFFCDEVFCVKAVAVEAFLNLDCYDACFLYAQK